MSGETFNNLVFNPTSSFGSMYSIDTIMPAFCQLSSGTQGFTLPGLLSGLQTGNNSQDSINMMVDKMFANFTNELGAKYAQLGKMIGSLNFEPPGTAPYSDEDTSYFSYDAQALKEKWSKKKPNLSDGFYNKVVEIAKRVGCDPNDLMALMNAESGLNPSAQNPSPGSTATGLIQFVESTAKRLGTTTAALKQMSAEEQLVYVEKYLKQTKAAAGIGENEKIGAGTLYALVFLPARSNRGVLTSRGETYYSQNSALDINGDGNITKDELGQRVRRFMA